MSQTNKSVVNTDLGSSNDLREFSDLLRFELAIDSLKTETIMDAIRYMQTRGFFVYKRKV